MDDFEWDPKKAQDNVAKHGVHFADAVGALDDEHGITVEDDGDYDERRWITIGRSHVDEIVVVVWTLREERNRLISARPAEKPEKHQYWGVS